MEKNNYFTIEGRMFLKKDTQVISDKFKKREFILEVTESYNDKLFTKTIPFELVQNNVDKLDYVGSGDKVRVDFVLDGREWAPKDEPDKKRYFGSNKAVFIQSLEVKQETQADVAQEQVNQLVNESVSSPVEEDDLPF